MEDLTGRRFGKLVAMRPGPKTKSGRTTWVCRCDCGKEKEILAYSLKCGDTRSCGCEHYPCRPLHSLVGRRVGKLVVLEYLPGSRYKCLCDCGNVVEVKTDKLSHGLTRSCGCLRRETAAKRATKHGGSKDALYAVLRGMHQRWTDGSQRQSNAARTQRIKITSGTGNEVYRFAPRGVPPTTRCSKTGLSRLVINRDLP